MSHTLNAMGGRKLFVLPERPAGEASLLIGTTAAAAGLGALFSVAMLLSVALHEPPAPRLADSAPSDAVPSHTSAVEAGAGKGGIR